MSHAPASPPTEIHFWHVPKTAGTSLANLIRGAFPPHERCPVHIIRDLVSMPSAGVRAYRCYTGHFFSLLEQVVGRQLPTVTVLRDPFEQTMSLVRHCQRIDVTGGLRIPLWCRAIDKAWHLVPRLRPRLEARYCPIVMNNFQTRVLGSDVEPPGRLRWNWYGLTYPFLHAGFASPERDMDALLARAKARLDRMAVVGTVERLPETASLIRAFLGLPSSAELPRANVAAGRPATGTYRTAGKVDPAFASLIDRQNDHDRELYRYAGTLLDERLRGCPPSRELRFHRP